MLEAVRYKLHFGPYRTPRFKYGGVVMDEVPGEVTIVGLSNAPIPWPFGQRNRAKSLVVFGRLADALRREANIAVAHWWGVAGSTVTKWRRLLGVPWPTDGDLLLKRAYGREPFFKRAQQKARTKARDPARRAKIAAALRGKKHSPEHVEANRKARIGRRLSQRTRSKMSETHRQRGTRPPGLNNSWELWEDEILRSGLRAAEVAKRTGRSLTAVYCRRTDLGLPDGRAKV